MPKRKILLDEFASQIIEAEKILAALECKSFDLAEQYNGHSFAEQSNLSVDLENRLIAISHETATEIGFLLEDILKLTSFIEFREQFKAFTDSELEEIIDRQPSLIFKKRILKKFDSMESPLSLFKNIQSEWNRSFSNTGYAKIKNQLRIDKQ